MGFVLEAIGRRLARFLSRPRPGYERLDRTPVHRVLRTLRPGDVLLVDGDSRVSVAIKYLTHSTWSHAALFIGPETDDPDEPTLLEADLNDGVVLVPVSKYATYNTRICRAVGASDEELGHILDFARSRLGHQYDLRNLTDLARYLIRMPPVPERYRRRLLSIGSGEPTKAICSTVIAEAYQSIRYPILPLYHREKNEGEEQLLLQARHYTHFVPGDFDLSPYFQIVKPTLAEGFDFRDMKWKRAGEEALQG